ncbi:MAG: hypothetical protein IJM71_01465 [Clostridia bacterium]|nr:hypothetical protein [Clostridia bacterium]
MSDVFWTAPLEYVRMKAVPFIVTAAIFAVFAAVTVVLVVRTLRGRDDGGDS